MLAQLKERRLNLLEFIAGSWAVTKERFKTLVVIVLIVHVPLALLRLIVLEWAKVPEDATKEFFHFLYSMPFFAAQLLVAVLPLMAIPFVVERALVNENVDYVRALKTSISRWWNAIVTETLATLIIGLGLLLFIIPGIIWSVYYSFSIYVVILRDKRGKAALDYSKSLVKPQWGWVFIVGVVLYGLAFIPCFILQHFFAFSKIPAVDNLVWGLIYSMISIYPIVGTTLLFLNLDYLKKAQEDASAGSAT